MNAMKWNDLVMAVRYVQPRKLAALMAMMWGSAARHGDDALLANLQINSLDPMGVAQYLDYAGIPPQEFEVQRFQQIGQPLFGTPIDVPKA